MKYRDEYMHTKCPINLQIALFKYSANRLLVFLADYARQVFTLILCTEYDIQTNCERGHTFYRSNGLNSTQKYSAH